MNFEDKYFIKFKFTGEQIKKNFNNALKDLNIAKRDRILEVKFNYAYSALIKAGITLLSYYQIRIKSIPGHHIKLIEKTAEILKDGAVYDIGNAMRSKRNLDLYGEGMIITEKECKQYIELVENILIKVKKVISKENN